MRSGRRMIARVAWVILVAPVMRCRLIAMFRKVAMTCADVPVRVWDRSSSKVTSRTWWTPFSMASARG